MEMHAVHLPTDSSTGFAGTAMGIIFDTKNYNAVLTKAEELIFDNFFESLDMERTSKNTKDKKE